MKEQVVTDATGSATMQIMLSVFKTLELRELDVFQEALALAKNAIIGKKDKPVM